jgi:hypothetical protein
MTAFEPVQIRELQPTRLRDQIGSKKFAQRWSMIQFDEQPVFPFGKFKRYETVLRAIKVAHIRKVRCAFQLTFERVSPAMIRTTKLRRFAVRFSHNSRGVMAANVEESAQYTIVSANDHDRLPCDVARDVIPGFA